MTKWLPGIFAGCMLVAVAQAAETPTYNRIHFQVSATESVGNDRMQAVLSISDQDKDAAKLADRINKAMAWALEQGRAAKGVELRSGGYSTQPVYQEERFTGWRASQELMLEGADFAQLGALIGTLQSRLQLSSVSFSVDKATRDKAEGRLIDQALNDYKQRAEQVRTNLGKPAYRIVDLQVQTEGGPVYPQPMMRAEAMMTKDMAPPALEGGESEVRVSVSGTIELAD